MPSENSSEANRAYLRLSERVERKAMSLELNRRISTSSSLRTMQRFTGKLAEHEHAKGMVLESKETTSRSRCVS